MARAPYPGPGHQRVVERQGRKIDVSQFVTVFQGSVKALLDWPAITDPSFSVTETFSRSRQVLGGLMTVWYVTPDGAPADFAEAAARPLSVAEAAGVTCWAPPRAGRLADLQLRFDQADEPVQLVLPGVRAPDGRIVLIDGNHRACAAYRAAADLRLLLFTLCGPTSAATLPDLKHHR